MATPGCPDCGKVLPAEGKCASCNLPPRYAAIHLTALFVGLLALLGVAYLMYGR